MCRYWPTTVIVFARV